MSKVIERLKASKEAFEEECKALGATDGKQWAEETAEYSELAAVASAEDPFSSPEDVFSAIDEDWQANWDVEVFKFYFPSGRNYAKQSAYLHAWAEAVIEVYEEVRRSL